jgi:4Fe-4S ferredoxin
MRQASTAACKQAAGVIAPVVDFTRCEGRGDCAVVIDDADYKQLGMLHKFKLRVHGLKVAYTPNADACRSCGLCVTACPERAITLARIK